MGIWNKLQREPLLTQCPEITPVSVISKADLGFHGNFIVLPFLLLGSLGKLQNKSLPRQLLCLFSSSTSSFSTWLDPTADVHVFALSHNDLDGPLWAQSCLAARYVLLVMCVQCIGGSHFRSSASLNSFWSSQASCHIPCVTHSCIITLSVILLDSSNRNAVVLVFNSLHNSMMLFLHPCDFFVLLLPFLLYHLAWNT
jgi:hypothetical protein